MAVRLEDLGPKARAQVRLQLRLSRPKRKTRKRQDLEESLAAQLRMTGIPAPVGQLRFHPLRRWRFDLAWPERHLAVEVDGGTWTGGGHVRGKHYESDCEKGNEAILLGWKVMHVTTDMVDDGRAVTFIERFFAGA